MSSLMVAWSTCPQPLTIQRFDEKPRRPVVAMGLVDDGIAGFEVGDFTALDYPGAVCHFGVGLERELVAM